MPLESHLIGYRACICRLLIAVAHVACGPLEARPREARTDIDIGRNGIGTPMSSKTTMKMLGRGIALYDDLYAWRQTAR